MAVDLAKLRALADTARAKTAQHGRRDASGRTWYTITNQADSAEIFIYEEIGAWGVDAKTFTAELRAITAPAITLHISSPGGSVADGLTIYEAVRQHPAYVTSSVEGLAASAASFIFQAGNRRRIAENGILLVHDASATIFDGTAADFEEMALLMNELSDNVASIYEERSGMGTAAQWRERMRTGGLNLGTRYIGQAAVDAGLADEVAGNGQAQNLIVSTAVSGTVETPTDAPGFDFAGMRDALKGVFQ